jgi:hypothetical protein
MPNVVLFSNEGISQHRRNFRRRPEPDRADSYGSSTPYRRPARETEALQSPCNLPDNRAALELANDRTGHVALVSAASRAGIPRVFRKRYYTLAAIHGALGMAAEILGLYIVLVAGTNILPQRLRFKRWKLWMRAELALWTLVLLGGAGTYYAWYIAPLS